jgi:hypothetical protein
MTTWLRRNAVTFESLPDGRLVGWRAARYQGGYAVSGADSRQRAKLRRGELTRFTGAGMFLANDRQYVIDYYAGHDQSAIMRYAFWPDDVVKGNLEDAQAEISVRVAELLDFEVLRENPSAIRSVKIKKGTLLYHGTSAEEAFEEDGAPDGPAWFTENPEVARFFQTWHGGPEYGRPRILVYRVVESIPDIAKIPDGQAFQVFLRQLERMGALEEGYGAPEELAEAMSSQRKWEGWRIIGNYSRPDGDDILLVSPESYLEFVGLLDGPARENPRAPGTKEQWHPGDKAWFEYHCFESDDSADAPAWRHSHQQVTVLEEVEKEARDEGLDAVARQKEGWFSVYKVRFEDGLEWDVFEDELLTNPRFFNRPDPPRENPRARRHTLSSLGLPTTWYHGTHHDFERLKPKADYLKAIWLGDLETATVYAEGYLRQGVIQVELDPNARVVDMRDVTDPIMVEYLALINEQAKYGVFGSGPSAEEWANKWYDYGELEHYRFSGPFFRSKKVDALLVRDVQGWSGGKKTVSLAVLNKNRILAQKRVSI